MRASGSNRPRARNWTPQRAQSQLFFSANQVGFLLNGLTPSVDGRPNFSRRSESEPFPKSGRLISVASDASRTWPTVFRSAVRRAFWILVENSTRSIGVSSGSSGSGLSNDVGLFAVEGRGRLRAP